MDPFLIISADGHATAPIQVYADYLEERYRDRIFELSRENEEYLEYFAKFGRPEPEEFPIFDTRGRLASGGEFGTWDARRRVEELDAEGVAGEFLLLGTQYSTTPFCSVPNRPWPAEMRAAGARAWNRWLADVGDASGGRLIGVIEPGPCHDMAATIAELRLCAERGLRSVTVPGSPADAALPPLHDPSFEPFWATCEELGLVLNVHAGWGMPQGRMQTTVEEMNTALTEAHVMDAQKVILKLDLGPRSVFWKLMLAGVFDRHTDLKLALVEIRADWVPATLAHLDERLTMESTSLRLKPSEYFARNCVVVPSSIHRSEVEMRNEIGVENLLFGMDYPHFEGTWPNTWDWLRVAFEGVPESDVRKILGENAIEVFGLDRPKFAAIAERIGPRPADVLTGIYAVDPLLVDHFDKRAGYKRPAEGVDLSALDEAVNEDIRSLAKL